MADAPDKIIGLLVAVECWHCHGDGLVPGGQIQYGEVVRCPVCGGRGWSSKRLPLDDVIRLVHASNPDTSEGSGQQLDLNRVGGPADYPGTK